MRTTKLWGNHLTNYEGLPTMDMPYSMESGNASDNLKTKEKQD